MGSQNPKRPRLGSNHGVENYDRKDSSEENTDPDPPGDEVSGRKPPGDEVFGSKLSSEEESSGRSARDTTAQR